MASPGGWSGAFCTNDELGVSSSNPGAMIINPTENSLDRSFTILVFYSLYLSPLAFLQVF